MMNQVKANRFFRGKYMYLFGPLVAGKVFENCGRVFAPTNITIFFILEGCFLSILEKKEDKKTPNFQQGLGHSLVNC